MSYEEESSSYKELDHMIIWLDQHIGDPLNYRHLKKVFGTQTDPRTSVLVNMFDADYDVFYSAENPWYMSLESSWLSLAAFTNVEDCIRCFEKNHEKRIFFITSDELGREAVPIILERFRKTFTDPITDASYTSIYVFCYDVLQAMEWAIVYCDYIQIFNFDADLLTRIIHDIADYYFTESKRILHGISPDKMHARRCLGWARKLYQRFAKMEHVCMVNKFNEIDELLENIERDFRALSNEDDELSS